MLHRYSVFSILKNYLLYWSHNACIIYSRQPWECHKFEMKISIISLDMDRRQTGHIHFLPHLVPPAWHTSFLYLFFLPQCHSSNTFIYTFLLIQFLSLHSFDCMRTLLSYFHFVSSMWFLYLRKALGIWGGLVFICSNIVRGLNVNPELTISFYLVKIFILSEYIELYIILLFFVFGARVFVFNVVQYFSPV